MELEELEVVQVYPAVRGSFDFLGREFARYRVDGERLRCDSDWAVAIDRGYRYGSGISLRVRT